MIRPLLLIATLATLLLAAPAADAAGGPKARADAKRMTTLYVEYSRYMERRVNSIVPQLEAENESCQALRREAPEDQLADRVVAIYLRTIVSRTDAKLARVARRMRGFKTRERTVRRVARAIGRSTQMLRALAERPPQLCPYLEAWKESGWASDFRIEPPLRNYTPAELAQNRRDARIIRRGLRRLRALGVPRSHIAKLRQDYVIGEAYGSSPL